MLKAPKRQVHLQIAQTHEALFAENYDLLMTWAMQFTERDREFCRGPSSRHIHSFYADAA